MVTKVQKWGNSLAVRIPKGLARETNVKCGSVVNLEVDKGRLIVSPAKPPRYRLEDLLADVRAENLHAEVDTGRRMGREVW